MAPLTHRLMLPAYYCESSWSPSRLLFPQLPATSLLREQMPLGDFQIMSLDWCGASWHLRSHPHSLVCHLHRLLMGKALAMASLEDSLALRIKGLRAVRTYKQQSHF